MRPISPNGLSNDRFRRSPWKIYFSIKGRSFKSFIWKLSSFPAKREVIPSIFHKGWNGTLVADYFERTRTNPSLHSLSERKSSWKVSRHRVSILNVNFKHDSNCQILLYLEFQGFFLRRGADDLF